MNTVLLCFTFTQEFAQLQICNFGFLHRHLNFSISKTPFSSFPPLKTKQNKLIHFLEPLFQLTASTLCNCPISKIEGNLDI